MRSIIQVTTLMCLLVSFSITYVPVVKAQGGSSTNSTVVLIDLVDAAMDMLKLVRRNIPTLCCGSLMCNGGNCSNGAPTTTATTTAAPTTTTTTAAPTTTTTTAAPTTTTTTTARTTTTTAAATSNICGRAYCCSINYNVNAPCVFTNGTLGCCNNYGTAGSPPFGYALFTDTKCLGTSGSGVLSC